MEPSGNTKIVYVGTVKYQLDDFLAVKRIEVTDDSARDFPAIKAQYGEDAQIEVALLQ